ncbi:MAG TPA: hypothetical protein VFC01_26110, partial [Mycobacterium sp.]|nr:hypothetical protein [Mycobacterium sp.]
SVRASAMAVTNSIGRLCTAAGPLVAGAIATGWFDGDIAMAATVISALIVIAFIGLAFLPETNGRFLHSEVEKEAGADAGESVSPMSAIPLSDR